MEFNFVLDVDGVLTTGQFLYSSDGKSHKIFGPHDADGLKLLKDKVNITFITADKRGWEISKKRIVDDMGYSLEFISEKDRYEYIKNKFGFQKTLFMGDGIFDAAILKDCFFGIAPANARQEAKSMADFVTSSKSGEGAVCDACIKVHELLFQDREKPFRVLIACAGTGSRLGNLTKETNKALIKVKGKEVITYIVDKFEENTEIVIALGYMGEKVKSFLQKTYPNRKFFFVTVDNFEGPGSSLGYSISKCREYLQCPFIFIPNDMVVLENIPSPNLNYIGYASERDISQFRSIELDGPRLLRLNEKKSNSLGLPYIGLMGVKDYALFWKTLDKDQESFFKFGESGAIRFMLANNSPFKAYAFSWFDTGNPQDLKKTEEELTKSNN